MISLIQIFLKGLAYLIYIQILMSPPATILMYIEYWTKKPTIGLIAIILLLVTYMYLFLAITRKDWIKSWKILSFYLLGVYLVSLFIQSYNIKDLEWKITNSKANIIGLVLMFIPLVLGFILLIYKGRKQINKKILPNKTNKEAINNPDSFYFNNGFISVDNPYRGIYIQGGAGSGKTASLIKPIIKQSIEKGFTGILYDFKGPELVEYATSFFTSDNEVKPYYLNFQDIRQSHRTNVIAPNLMDRSAYAFDYSEAILQNLMPETIEKKDFFSRSAKTLFAGVIWWLKTENPKYCTLPHAISLILHSDAKKLVDTLSKNYEVAGMVSSLKEAMDREAERQVAGVIGTLKDSLAILNTPDIFWLLSGDDFDLDINNPLYPKYLMIANDSTLSDTFAPLIALVISVSAKTMNKPNKKKSIIILDEAPTIYIPRFEQIPATGRENKIATLFSAQDYSQIEDRYGEQKANTIISNLGNQFFGRTTNKKSAETISTLFSKSDRSYIGENRGKGSSGGLVFTDSYNSNRGTSESIQERDRVKVNEIINLPTGYFYGFIAEGRKRELVREGIRIDYTPTKTNIPINNDISNNDLRNNYIKIIEEAKQLIK